MMYIALYWRPGNCIGTGPGSFLFIFIFFFSYNGVRNQGLPGEELWIRGMELGPIAIYLPSMRMSFDSKSYQLVTL